MDKDCVDCKYYCDNKWRITCLNEKIKDGVTAIEKGKEMCGFWEEEDTPCPGR